MRARTAALILLFAPSSTGWLVARHQDHQMPEARMDSERAAVCVQSQQRGFAAIEQISRRLETARVGKSPADLRGAIDDLQAALGQLRTTLRDCAVPAEASPTGLATSTPAAPVDHAAMGHAAPTTMPAQLDPQLVGACVQSQQEAAELSERQIRRLELARQTNAAEEMRAGISGLPAPLGELRTSLEKCEPLRAMGGTTPSI